MTVSAVDVLDKASVRAHIVECYQAAKKEREAAGNPVDKSVALGRCWALEDLAARLGLVIT